MNNARIPSDPLTSSPSGGVMSGRLLPILRRRAFRAPLFPLLAALLALGALLGTSGEARAQATETTVVAVSNQDQTSAGPLSWERPYAQGFTTGPDTDGYTMTAIVVEFARGTSQGDDLYLQLRPAANGGGPAGASAAIANFTRPDNLNSAGDKTFTLPAKTKLAANTEYFVFISFSGTVSGIPHLRSTGSDNEDSGALLGWSMADVRYQLEDGNWVTNDNALQLAVRTITTGERPFSPVTLISNVGQGGVDDSNLDNDRAQSFTTGSNSTGYTLTSVEIVSNDSDDDDVSVSLCTVDGSGFPTSTCTALTAPGSFAAGTLAFTAPSNTTLDANTTYTLLITSPGGQSLNLGTTNSDNEDSGGATGWSIGNAWDFKIDSGNWAANGVGRSLRITVKGAANVGVPGAPTSLAATPGDAQVWLSWAAPDSDGGASLRRYRHRHKLSSASSWGSWTELTGTTATVTGLTNGSAYDFEVQANNTAGWGASASASATPAVGLGVHISLSSAQTSPIGLWSPDGETLWVGQWHSNRIYAYKLSYGSLDTSQQWNLTNSGGSGDNNRKPTGFYSDGTHIWVSDVDHDRVFRYDFSSKSHNSGVNLALHSDNGKRQGLWSDGTTAWISDSDDNKLYAYQLSDFSRDSGKDMDLHSDNGEVRGIWSDGTIIWALDRDDEVIYAYTLSDGSREAGLDITLPSDGVNYNSIWSNGTTMYVIENASGSTRNPQIHRLMIPGAAVSITSGGDVDEGSDAVFTLTRSNISGTLDVDVLVAETGGDMVAAGDETTHTVSFAAGVASAELRIATAEDAPRIVDSEVTATIQPGAGYAVGANGAATVTVFDDDAPPIAVSNLGLATDKTIELSNSVIRAQGFTTGTQTDGYILHSVLVDFDKKPSSSGNLTVVLRAKDGDNDYPSESNLFLFTKPDNLGSPGTKTFTAPANTTLTANTTYYVSITDAGTSNRGEVRTSADDGEDSDALTGWSIGNGMHNYSFPDGWETSTDSILIGVRISRTPYAPANLRAGIGADRLGLFWDAPLYDGGTAVTKYRHRHKLSSASTWGAWTETTDAATKSATITGLTAGTEYDFQVQARNAVDWGPSASVSAEPSTREPRISIEAVEETTSDDSLRNRVRFRVSSDMAPASDLTVYIHIDEESDTRSDLGHSYGTERRYTDIHAGDMISGSDQGQETVTISAGTTTATHSIQVWSDNAYEQDTTVTALMQSGTGYVVGTPSSASVRVLDADMPVDTYAIDSDGNPHGYPYDYPGGYRDYAVELVVGEDAGTVELRYECITWEDRPHPRAGLAWIVATGRSAVVYRDGTGDYLYVSGDPVDGITACMNIDNPGERVFREGRWRYRNVVTFEVQIVDDDQYEGTEQFFVELGRLAGTGPWSEYHEGKCGYGNICREDAGWLFTILDRGDAGAGLGPDGDGVYPPGAPQHHWIEVSNPEDPDSPGQFTSAATVTLKWWRPLSGGRDADDTYSVGGIAIQKYQIRHRRDFAATWGSWTDVAGISNPNAHPHEGGEFSASFDVDYGQLRLYEIRAVNVDGVEGAVLGTSVHVVKPPEAPTNLTAYAGNGKVELRWEDSSTPGVIIGGEVRWRRTTSDNSGTWSEWDLGGIGRGLVEGLQNGVSYDFQARSYLPYGQGLPGGTTGTPQASSGVRSDAPPGGTSNGKGLPSRVVRSTPKAGALLPSEGGPLAPPAPADLSAEAAGEGRIDLAWTAPAGEVTGYRVEWSPEGGTSWTAVEPPHTGLLPAYGHAGLTASTTYRYRVQALNDGASGPWSAVVSAITEEARPNSPATGLPTISGTAQVGETLAADTSGIGDADGLANVSYSYQWVANDGTSDADISGATGSSYTLAGADLGKAVRVRVSFTDDRGHEETLTSAATGPVLAASPPQEPEPPGDETLVWSADMTVVDYETGAIGAGSADLFANQVSADNHRAKWLWAYTPDRQVYLSLQTFIRDTEGLVLYIGGLALPFGDASGLYSDFTWDGVDVDWQDGQTLAARIARPAEVSEPAANSPATGQPVISGTAQVGETLTADVSGIADENGLTNATFAYQWSADSVSIAGATSAAYTPVDADVGKTVSVTVSFTDDAGNAESLTSAATEAVAAKANSPATGLPTISGTAQVAETLTADTSGIADEDGLDNVSYSYQWVANDGSSDADISGATDSTYTLTFAEAEKTISVRVSFTDDRGNAETLTSAATEAVSATSQQQANTPATGQPVISGTAQVGQTLTADISSISDDDGLADAVFSYQWRADGSDIADATGSTYTLVDADAGKTVSVTVSFTDDRGHAEALTSAATDTVAPKPNTPATGLPTISGTAQVGETLTADTSGIADEDGVDNSIFNYEWRADGSDIAGATASSYTLTDADEGKTISVTVSFTDDAGHDESLTSAATAEVQPKPNSPATGAPTISGTAQVGQTLTADVSGIADEDGLTNAAFSYQWQADGSDIAGATGSTYTLADVDEGRIITVTVSFTDNAGNAESLTSTATTAVAPKANSPATGQPIIIGAAQVEETLSVDTSGIADEDGLDDVSYSYQWQADGSDIAGSTDSTYTLVDADEGKIVSVTVSFADDAGNAESLTSAATEAVKAKPNTPATGQPVISGTAQVGETLSVDTSSIADEDGLDDATFAHQWAADGADIADATDSAYTLSDADEGKTISVRVSFTDDRGNAEALTSAATDAVAPKPNTPATGQPIISGTPQVGETLTADTSGIADADGLDNVSFSYQWWADGADIADATGSAYTLVDADAGKAVSVTVSFTDDRGNNESLTSAATEAVAGPPQEPLTASFSNEPSSHDGENVFTFDLHFSEEFSVSYKRLRDQAFIASGGDVTRAKRLEQGSNVGWRIHVRPDGEGAVTIILPETTDCDDDGAICTGDGRMLSNRNTITVNGP